MSSPHEQYSTVLKDTDVPNVHGEIRRSWKEDLVPVMGHVGGSQTLYESFRHGARINPLGPCLGFRAVSTSGMATPFIYSSYSECLARVNAFAAGLDELNLLNTKSDFKCLGLYMKNCMEWVMAEHAAFSVGGVTVPLYDTLGPNTVHFVLEQTETQTVVCTRSELPNLCSAKQEASLKNELNSFQSVVLVDGVTTEAAKMAEQANLQALSYAKVEAVGARRIAERGHKHSPPSSRDLATFCYTSGTTGMPKGAMLSHLNMVSAMAAMSAANDLANAHMYDRHLSYLPLAHIFERVVLNNMLSGGASIAFYRGKPELLIEDMQACQPTALPVAPRVLNKIYDKIHAGFAAAGGFKKKLFYAAVEAKTKGLLEHGRLKHTLYDALLFNKIKKGLGMDQLRLVASGSAPLAGHVLTFFRILLGIPVAEGYGQTEGAAAATVSHSDDYATAGHVGGPGGGIEVVLFDVPDMGYYHTDTEHDGQPCQGRGEICIRGPNVFMGYYKDEEKTRETIDEQGWLHSGDIGLWRPSGVLQIIDRKKNLFKLAQGEYVAPEKIENILTRSPLIAQAFVHGDSLQTSLVAVIVPDEEVVIPKYTKQEGMAGKSFEDLCQSKQLKADLMADIRQLSQGSGLHGFETVKAIHVDHMPFSVENDLLTPTFKLKRQQASKYYKAEIDRMYSVEVPKPQSKL
mmetsp:Transcript_10719/g.29535  ORF Transcript_10719/g.29535 Transcript_10719/m.29535 type:complete len:686 (+) Transcript_10719:30-2087(+)